MEKKRIFAAIDISSEARERIAAYTRSLQQEFENVPVKWEKPDKLHITIKFVGSIDESELAAFTDTVAKAAAKITPFSIIISGTGAFVKRRARSNVLWLGLNSSPDKTIESLVAAIDREASEPSERRFRPHLTIARLKDAKKARGLIERHLQATFEPVTFHVSEIVIYESTLLPTGSIYNALSKHNFDSAQESRLQS